MTPKTESVCKHCQHPPAVHDRLGCAMIGCECKQFVPVSEPASTGEPKDAVSDQYGFGTTPERVVCNWRQDGNPPFNCKLPAAHSGDHSAARPSDPSAPQLHCQECREVITFNDIYKQWFHADGTSTYPKCTRPKPAPSPAPSVSTPQDYRYREVAELAMEYSGQQGNDILAAPSVAGTQPTPAPIFSSPQEILKDFPAEPPQTEPLDLAAQGTPEPLKVEEIFDRWSALQEVYCDEELNAPSVKSIAVSFAKHLRPYFPPASQTPTLKAMTQADQKTYDPIAELEYIAKEISGEDIALEDLSGRLEFAIQVLKEMKEYVATPASTARTDGWVSVEIKPTEPQIAAHRGWFHVANEVTKRQDIAKYLKGDFMGHALQFNEVTHWRELPAAPSSVPQAPKDECLYGPVGKHIFNPHDDEPRRCVNCGVPQAEPPKSELEEVRHQLKVKDIAATAIAVVLRAKCSDREWDNLPEEMRVQTDRVTELVERAEAAEKRVKELAGAAQPGDAPQKEQE